MVTRGYSWLPVKKLHLFALNNPYSTLNGKRKTLCYKSNFWAQKAFSHEHMSWGEGAERAASPCQLRKLCNFFGQTLTIRATKLEKFLVKFYESLCDSSGQASVLLLIMNFIITLSSPRGSTDPLTTLTST